MRVFPVDDSAAGCRMVRALLARCPYVVVAARPARRRTASRSSHVGARCRRHGLLDAGVNGVEGTAELCRTRPELRVVGFTSADDRHVRGFMAAGVSAVFAKDDAIALRDYLRAAAAVR